MEVDGETESGTIAVSARQLAPDMANIHASEMNSCNDIFFGGAVEVSICGSGDRCG